MHERQAGIAMADTLDSSDASMRRAVVHNSEDATGIVIRQPHHHLFGEPIKRGDAMMGFQRPKTRAWWTSRAKI
jgi:hypothetical protein